MDDSIRGLILESNLSRAEKAVLNSIDYFIESFDEAYPSTETLVRHTGYGKSQISEVRKALKDKGVLKWIPGYSGQSNKYSIDRDRLAELSSHWTVQPVETVQPLDGNHAVSGGSDPEPSSEWRVQEGTVQPLESIRNYDTYQSPTDKSYNPTVGMGSSFPSVEVGHSGLDLTDPDWAQKVQVAAGEQGWEGLA